MSYTRQHYKDTAEILREHSASIGLIERFVALYIADSPRFDPQPFRAACKRVDIIA